MLDALKTLHSFGLHDGEIFYQKEGTTVYEYSAGSLKLKNSGIDEGFGIRVLKDKKLGFSYANSKKKLGDIIRGAASLSKFSQPSRFSFAAGQQYENANICDEKIAEADENELGNIVSEIADGIKKYSEPLRIVLVSGISETAIANTSPLFAQERGTILSAYAEAKNGNGLGVAEYSHYKMLEKPRELGERAGLMAKEMKNPKRLPAGKYAVLFSPEALSSLFDLLLFSFSGELKRRRISRIWDKEGEKIFDGELSVCDDPAAEAAGKNAFDGEGVASKKTALIEKGTVRNFYYDRETAAFAGLEREGNCARTDYRVPPSLGGSNTVVKTGGSEPGTELKKYVEIISMHGLHTANTTTGDFGCEVSIAFLHENGKKIPVRGFMVSENIFNLFRRIEGIGKRQVQAGDFVSPQIAFGDVLLVS